MACHLILDNGKTGRLDQMGNKKDHPGGFLGRTSVNGSKAHQN